MKEGQNAIYYQVAPSRAAIENGPYIEAFKSRGFEVIYLFEPIDDYVVNALREFDGKSLQSLASDKVELDEAPPAEGEALSTEDADSLCTWLKDNLGKRVENVRTGKRLVNSPAIALLPEGELTPQMRQMMRALRKDDELSAPEVVLEINPRSALIKNLSGLKDKDSDTAGLIAQQLLDNTLLSAGLIEDPQPVITRSLQIMEKLAAKLN